MKISNVFRRIAADFSLSSASPVYFLRSEWETPRYEVSWLYFTYRLVFASYFVSTTVSNIVCGADKDDEGLSFYLTFLTNWTYAMQLIYATAQAVNVGWSKFGPRFSKRSDAGAEVKGSNAKDLNYTSQTTIVRVDNDESGNGEGEEPSVLEKVIWILFNVVNVIPYGVTIIYWAFLFDSASDSDQATCARIHNYFVHALNSVAALLDAWIVGIPIRISHMVFPVAYGFLYMIFSILYEVWNGQYAHLADYIYKILDWRNSPGAAAVTCVLGLVVVALAHLGINWGGYKLKRWLHTRRCGGNDFTLDSQ